MAAGAGQTLALQPDGQLWGWGQNEEGQAGTGDTTEYHTPQHLSLWSGVTAVTAQEDNSCAIEAGAVWCVGENSFGQIGNGTTGVMQLDPAKALLPAGKEAVALATGDMFNCAVLADGTVWCWGYGGSGQLGNGQFNGGTVPVQVTGLTGATAVTAGQDDACAVTVSDAVWCWGDNTYGELGNGTTTGSATPVQVKVLSGVTQVAAGAFHACAVVANHSVMCWGLNTSGQLGNGGTTNSSVPVAVEW